MLACFPAFSNLMIMVLFAFISVSSKELTLTCIILLYWPFNHRFSKILFMYYLLRYLYVACNTNKNIWTYFYQEIKVILRLPYTTTSPYDLEMWKSTRDKETTFSALLIDLSEAFNCLSQKLLLAKLHAWILTLIPMNSYLKKHKQKNKIKVGIDGQLLGRNSF